MAWAGRQVITVARTYNNTLENTNVTDKRLTADNTLVPRCKKGTYYKVPIAR